MNAMRSAAPVADAVDVRWPEDREISALIEPYVIDRFGRDDPRWREMVGGEQTKQRAARRRRRLIGWMPRFRRTQTSIGVNYSEQWKNRSLDVQLGPQRQTIPFAWRSEGFRAPAVSFKRVHLLFMMRIVAALKPRRILEIGSGNGLNLFMLAGRFPDVQCVGVELTSGGVGATREVAARPGLPEVVRQFAPEPLVDLAPFQRVHIVRATAAMLPIAERSVDLVITSLALEQMEEIRGDVLREIRRVTGGYALMIEAFRDWNEEGTVRRDFIVANDYFAGSLDDLRKAGFDVVYANGDLPSKLTYQAGVVLARPARG